MGTVSRVHTFSAGSVLTAAQLNNEFDNLLTSSAINGGLDATNLGVTAGQVTASKALVVDSSRNLDDTTTTNMINNLTLSGTLKLIDDQALTLGTNDDITVKYDETTNDALEIAAAVEGAALAVVLKADQGDDAGDEWKLGVADGGVLTLGNDIASAGTYVTGLTITPNSTTASWLLDFEGDVDVGGDTLSFNAAATIDTSGNNNLTLSAGTADVVVTASNLAPASNDGSAIGVSGTAWSDVFLASGAVVNFNAGDVTLTHSSNTLTVAGGTLATAALTASTITASGIVKTDDTTDATSTTDGSLQTDGGLSVAKDAVIGDDLKLLSDSAVLSLGADSDATLTHDGTTGVTIAANPITVDSGAALTLDAHTGVFVFKDAGSEVLRFTEGNSGDVTVKLATDGKDLVFTDNGDATNLKILDAAAGINVPGEVQTTKIAYTDGDDAITIADGGGATFSQTLTVGSNGSGKDVQFYGDTSGSNVLVDASADDLILTNFGLAVGSDATGDIYYRNSCGFLARLGVGSNGQVLTTNGTIPSWGSAGGSGDFSGPGSSTDNAVVRFDGTGGKTGQNSGVTIDDSNNATGFANLTLTGELDAATGDFSGAVDIAGDLTLSAGTDGALRFTPASSIKIVDNSGVALVVEEADTAYMTFVTTDSSEAIKFDKALDINAAMQIDSTVTVGVDDTGHDVKFFGATSGKYMEWDESADTLNVVGNAGVGIARTDGTLHVHTASAGSVTASVHYDDLVVESGGNTGISILAPEDSASGIAFGSDADNDVGYIYAQQSGTAGSRFMAFGVNAAERFRVEADGDVRIGGVISNESSTINAGLVSISGAADGEFAALTLRNSQAQDTGTNETTRLDLTWADGGGNTAAGSAIIAGKEGTYATAGAANSYLAFSTTASNTVTERLRIKSDGDIQVGANADIRIGNGVLDVDATETYGNSFMSQGVTLNQGGSDNEIMAFKANEVSHNMTSLAEADTYGVIQKQSGTAGGASLRGFADTADNPAVTLISYMTGISSTKSTSGNGAIGLQASLTNGSGGAGSCASDDNLVCIHNHGTTRFIFDAEGSAHADVEWTTFDTHDDIAMLHDIEATMVPDTFGKAMKYDQEYLMKIGILGKNSLHEEMPGRTRGMINTTKLSMLHHGAIRQVHQQLQDVKEFYEDKIAALEQRLLRLEA